MLRIAAAVIGGIVGCDSQEKEDQRKAQRIDNVVADVVTKQPYLRSQSSSNGRVWVLDEPVHDYPLDNDGFPTGFEFTSIYVEIDCTNGILDVTESRYGARISDSNTYPSFPGGPNGGIGEGGITYYKYESKESAYREPNQGQVSLSAVPHSAALFATCPASKDGV